MTGKANKSKGARFVIRQAKAEDIEYVAAHLRESDAVEVLAAHNENPAKVVLSAGRWGGWKKVIVVNGLPAVIFGCAPTRQETCGMPWMLATDDIHKISRGFLLQSRRELERMQRDYVLLANLVHQDNALSIRWLTWLGFQIDRRPAGANGRFFLFTRRSAAQ